MPPYCEKHNRFFSIGSDGWSLCTRCEAERKEVHDRHISKRRWLTENIATEECFAVNGIDLDKATDLLYATFQLEAGK